MLLERHGDTSVEVQYGGGHELARVLHIQQTPEVGHALRRFSVLHCQHHIQEGLGDRDRARVMIIVVEVVVVLGAEPGTGRAVRGG